MYFLKEKNGLDAIYLMTTDIKYNDNGIEKIITLIPENEYLLLNNFLHSDYKNKYLQKHPELDLTSIWRDPNTNQPTQTINNLYGCNPSLENIKAYKNSFSNYISTVEQIMQSNNGQFPNYFIIL